MSATLLIARRELGAYLRSWSGYIIIALVLFVDGLLFNSRALGGIDKRSSEVLRIFFNDSSGIVAIAASVLLSMRLLAEERQTGTLTLLYSSPVRDAEIVLGKFLAALAFLGILLASTLYMPLLILVHGKISFGHLAAGYLGLFLLGGAVIAVGLLGSALSGSPLVAGVTSACLVAALVISWMLSQVTERPLNELFAGLALWSQHFPPFMVGVIHLRDVVYYLAIIYVFLFGATRVLEARRWR